MFNTSFSTFTLCKFSAQVTETHYYDVVYLLSFLNMLQMFGSKIFLFSNYTFLPVVLFQASLCKTSSSTGCSVSLRWKICLNHFVPVGLSKAVLMCIGL